jgi:hypothetical protein
MAYVEDIFSEENVQAPPEHLLFTMLDNWQPTSHFREEDTSTTSVKKLGSNIGTKNCVDFPICYIEEELPEEMVPQEATIEAGHPLDTGTGSDAIKGVGGEQLGDAVPSEAEGNRLEDTPGEGGKIPSPPPILSMHEQ